jgi:hypothetical protein
MKFLPYLALPIKASELWNFVFYIHQAMLFFSVQISYFLSLEFSKLVGIPRLRRLLFVSVLFVFSVPSLRTISYNQVNFYILISILAAIILHMKYPVASGGAIAFGGLIKLYPFFLIIPSLLMKKWKILFGIMLMVTGALMLQTNYFQDVSSWKQFALFFIAFPMERESSWFRNTSLLSFVRSITEMLSVNKEFVLLLFIIAVFSVMIWFLGRFWKRERIFLAREDHEQDKVRSTGNLVDFSVLSLLIAPSAWEHHYVIAIPLAIWAFALSRKDENWYLWAGIAFVFLLPVFNVFPFSYLRLLGVIFLLLAASPKKDLFI